MREIPEGGGIGAPNFLSVPFEGKLSYQPNSKRFGTSNSSSERKIGFWTFYATGITIRIEYYQKYKTWFSIEITANFSSVPFEGELDYQFNSK